MHSGSSEWWLFMGRGGKVLRRGPRAAPRGCYSGGDPIQFLSGEMALASARRLFLGGGGKLSDLSRTMFAQHPARSRQ